jgi:hypothetical protein
MTILRCDVSNPRRRVIARRQEREISNPEDGAELKSHLGAILKQKGLRPEAGYELRAYSLARIGKRARLVAKVTI